MARLRLPFGSKLRSDRLASVDRELVGLVRKLGYYIDQLQSIRGTRVRKFEPIFKTISGEIDRALPPAAQGRGAAAIFRSMTDLEHGQAGIGEWVRPTLRRLGVLVVESPIKSSVEGCTFMVGADAAQTPCLFANSYRSTWFHRNSIIPHELAHAIFDLENDPVSLDFRDHNQADEVPELRAQTFAQECLMPKSVLVQCANRFGVNWSSLSKDDLAQLVAASHAEQGLILKAAFEEGFINHAQLSDYSHYQCDESIRKLSSHALSTREYLRSVAADSPKWIAENRNTSLGRRPLRLPSAYVEQVLAAFKAGDISMRKASEMLMMEEETFCARFCPEAREDSLLVESV